MADIPSRAFKNGEFFHAKTNLVAYFNLHFPLPQNLSWHEFKLHPKLTSRVISCLRGEELPMESLCRMPKQGENIGKVGQEDTVMNATQTHTWKKPLQARIPPHRLCGSSQDQVYGYRDQVHVQTVTQALAAISASCQLVLGRKQSPIYESEGEYILPLKRLTKGSFQSYTNCF